MANTPITLPPFLKKRRVEQSVVRKNSCCILLETFTQADDGTLGKLFSVKKIK